MLGDHSDCPRGGLDCGVELERCLVWVSADQADLDAEDPRAVPVYAGALPQFSTPLPYKNRSTARIRNAIPSALPPRIVRLLGRFTG